MSENRSLDEFLSAERDADAEEAADAGEAVEPIVPTCGWSPDGAPCDDCGAIVEERWRDGDALVCVDCKEW